MCVYMRVQACAGVCTCVSVCEAVRSNLVPRLPPAFRCLQSEKQQLGNERKETECKGAIAHTIDRGDTSNTWVCGLPC